MTSVLQVVPIIAIVAAVVLYLWSGVWICRDADRRGKPGMLVAILALVIAWPISLLVWIALRPEPPRSGFNLQDYRVQ
jgi:hypothetical protein